MVYWKFLIPLVPVSYWLMMPVSWINLSKRYTKNENLWSLNRINLQNDAGTNKNWNLLSNFSVIKSERPVNCVGLPPDISITMSCGINFLFSWIVCRPYNNLVSLSSAFIISGMFLPLIQNAGILNHQQGFLHPRFHQYQN